MSWWLTQWALDLTKQLQSFNINFLNLNWVVVCDKMYCIYLSLYRKKKQTYSFQRDERLSYKHLRSFCAFFLNAAYIFDDYMVEFRHSFLLNFRKKHRLY